MAKATEIKVGRAIEIDGQIWMITKTEHVKPGKGGAFIQAKIKNLKFGSVQEKRFRSDEQVDMVILDRRSVEYLYSDNIGGIFMDPTTYEQHTIPTDILGDALLYVKPNDQLTGLFHEEIAISVDLHPTATLEVADCPPGIKNATATNVMKEATMETGLKVKVPEFINIGEKIRINTETCEYLSRA